MNTKEIPATQAIAPRPPYILVVDDHEFRRQWTKRALAGGRYRVYAVDSAQQGLRYLRQVWFDVVVVGEHLRGMGATRFQAEIQHRYPDIRTVVVAFTWPVGRNVGTLSPGGYHCLLLCTQDPQREEALRTKIEEALAHAPGEKAES